MYPRHRREQIMPFIWHLPRCAWLPQEVSFHGQLEVGDLAKTQASAHTGISEPQAERLVGQPPATIQGALLEVTTPGSESPSHGAPSAEHARSPGPEGGPPASKAPSETNHPLGPLSTPIDVQRGGALPVQEVALVPSLGGTPDVDLPDLLSRKPTLEQNVEEILEILRQFKSDFRDLVKRVESIETSIRSRGPRGG